MTLNQQNAQPCSFGIYITISHSIFLHVLVPLYSFRALSITN